MKPSFTTESKKDSLKFGRDTVLLKEDKQLKEVEDDACYAKEWKLYAMINQDRLHYLDQE